MAPRKKTKGKAASEGIAPAVVFSEEPKRGRPTSYTEEIAADICRRVADGETLKQVCRSEHMPSESTVRGWALDDREGFSARYARARDLCLEAWADDIVEISDDSTNDWMRRHHGDDDKEAPWVINGEHVSRSKLRTENRKWLLSKLKPERYGDKMMHAGHDGGALTVPVINVTTTPGSS